MRTDLVELMTPEIEGGLIAADAPGFQLAPHVEVHALMGRVVLWTTRSPALQGDAQSRPPDRKTTQAEQAVGRSKGSAVVAADRLGQAVPLEESFKTGTDDFGLRTLHRAQLEDEATVFVSHGERFDLAALKVAPVPLEVHAPNGVGGVGATLP